jgi:hypothetical protein
MLRAFRRLNAAADLLRPSTFFRTLARVDQIADTTKELATTVEILRIRTEQLVAIEHLDWEQRDELRRLPEVLDVERISAHATRAVEAAPLHDDPFPHIVVEQWLPREVYDTVIRSIPPAIFFADRDVRRQRLIVPFSIAPAYSQHVWLFIAQDVVGRILHRALNHKFRCLVRDYVRSFCPAVPEELDLTLHPSDGRIMLRRPGYVITPHRDPKWGFMTGLVYLARDGDSETYGTQLYRVKDDAEAPNANPLYVETDRCELVKAVPFRANSLLVFLNSAGAHGASIPADALPPTLERYVYQFRLGPDSGTIKKLVSLMTPERSRMWAGTKSTKHAADDYDPPG